MESEKVKEIKKALECISGLCKDDRTFTCYSCVISQNFTEKTACKEALTLINELESENEKQHKRIMELEQDLVHADENVFYRECNVALQENKIKAEGLKQFGKRLKEKSDFYRNGERIVDMVTFDDIDEALKECINGKV